MERHHDWDSKLEGQVLDSLEHSLTDAFGHEAHVKVHSGLDFYHGHEGLNASPDGVIELSMSAKDLKILVEIIGSAYPRDIRDAVWRLDSFERNRLRDVDSVRMIAAESLSPGAKKELKERDIAFFELGGSLYLKHGHWLVDIQRPSKPNTSRRAIQLFTGARENVIHSLLVHSHEWLTGTELSNLAETSQYTCSLVLQELTQREWCESVGGGPTRRRRLVNPGALLDAWAEQWQARARENSSTWYTFVESSKHLLARAAETVAEKQVDYPWAFTGTAAGNVFAPLLTSTDTVDLIVPKGYTQDMADVLGLKPAKKGSNVTITEREGASLLFRQPHPEYPAYFASPYILYLDLLDGRGRNKELAEHIRNFLEVEWARN
ncbi:type IV toxin-antitoxin system AbiEi family antitoxin [Pseudomonas sp. FW300-N2F2]|uniref:type IV toxin-antitoxin system AbiEi family antitoxin n=1 Tax=Pseudomonas sp. FW300-N2F2 TaxID=2751320 RepID=UPI001A92CE15|nr:type IV toxin-antitoxin system AbiEi family antitoxin [Pseudomonas sp. FW300-N2F2]